MSTLAYEDLENPEYVFKGLLGHGMFTQKLPPCFTSLSLVNEELRPDGDPGKKQHYHSYIEYRATRNTEVPRQLAIPHPEAYWILCDHIRQYWQDINRHIGIPEVKFNHCHVRRIKSKDVIFEINYEGQDKWQKEELMLDYALGCQYVVSADISTCFPSMYTHSIPWAVKNKEWAKIHKCSSWNKKNETGCSCRLNDNLPCRNERNELWPNDLDLISRLQKDGETNGFLIGPHTSNIIAELILSQIDCELQISGFKKVIRHIDDFTFFAPDEIEAKNFLRILSLTLKKYELSLNAKKTTITPYHKFESLHWKSKLNQFSFPNRDKIGFTTINAYIDYAMSISQASCDFAALNYAIKIIAQKDLSDRARRLYIKKILQISMNHPYIIPLLEEHVFIFAGNNFEFLQDFLQLLLKHSLLSGSTDSLAFLFYFAIKYHVPLTLDDDIINQIIAQEDCIAMLLAYKYCKANEINIEPFTNKAADLQGLSGRSRDKYWLFLYEIIPAPHLSGYLKKLKQQGISFFISDF